MSDLRQLFGGVAWKRLVPTEVDLSVSHGHELHGVGRLRALLGDQPRRVFPTTFLQLGRDADETLQVDGEVTWYDARERNPTRSEYRLYYPSNAVTDAMEAGELLVVARAGDHVFWMVAEEGSSAEAQLRWIFALEDQQSELFVKPVEPRLLDSWVAVAAALESIGVDLPPSPPEQRDDLAETIDHWAREGLPTTAVLSDFARGTFPDFMTMAVEDPDEALVQAMEREEWIFRQVERVEVERRLSAGFDGVDDFLSYSLTVQNRRKARAGLAFEHHIAAVLQAGGVHFERGVLTENDAKPDFVLPSGTAYHDLTYPDDRLGMLGAKRTCKDRWRQVLAEAERVREKHLVTVEPAISRSQTDEMGAKFLQLVVPATVASSYKPDQRRWLMTLAELIQWRREVQ